MKQRHNSYLKMGRAAVPLTFEKCSHENYIMKDLKLGSSLDTVIAHDTDLMVKYGLRGKKRYLFPDEYGAKQKCKRYIV